MALLRVLFTSRPKDFTCLLGKSSLLEVELELLGIKVKNTIECRAYANRCRDNTFGSITKVACVVSIRGVSWVIDLVAFIIRIALRI